MSENDNGTADDTLEIIATVLGEKLRLILPSMGWTFDEAIEASDATGGLGNDEILDRFLVGDPRACLAVLRVSYMRAGKPFPAEEIGAVNMKALTDAFNAKVEEILGKAEAKRPPTKPSGKGSRGSTGSKKPAPSAAPDSA